MQIADKSWCDRARGTHCHSATCTPNSVEGLGRVRSLGGHEARWPWRKLPALTSEGFLPRCHSGHTPCMWGLFRVGGIAEGRHSQIAPRTLGCRLLWRISVRSLSMSPDRRLRNPKHLGARAYGTQLVTAVFPFWPFLPARTRGRAGQVAQVAAVRSK